MKKLLLVIAAGLIFSACGEEKKSDADTGSNLSEKQHMYGQEFDFSAPVGIDKMVSEMANSTDEKEYTFKGKVVESCAVAGCWMTVELPSGDAMRVKMGDHKFAVPLSGIDGMDCVVTGKAYNKVTSVEELRHYLEDANRPQEEIDAITEEKSELEFMATGVLLEGDIAEMDEHEGHDHGDHEGHDHDDHEGHDHDDHEGHDHDGDDHEGHDHDDHEGHDHEEEAK